SFPLEADGTIIDMGALSTGDGDPPSEGTEVFGDVGGQTWTKEGNPYLVVDYLWVSEGTTLTIQPGVEVQFGAADWGYGMCVDGILHWVGTPEERIIFTNHPENPYPEWNLIHIHESSTNLSHSVIDYVTAQVAFSIQGRHEPPVRISHSLIHHNAESGINVYGNAELFNNTITHNGDRGISVNGPALFKNNIVTENGEYGISWWYNEPEVPILSHNNVWGNGASPDDNYHDISPGTGDISVDPLFINPASGNYRLRNNSLCIDKGDPDTDNDGVPWQDDPDDQDPDETRMDMGAFYRHQVDNPNLCFLPGTPILMSDGTELPIEEVKVGDKVLAFDEETGEFKEDKVVEFFQHPAEEYLIINEYLKVTKNHPVYSNGKWVEIGTLTIGDELFNRDSKPVRITSIKEVREPTEVYNLEVNPYHTYIAGGIVAHNKPPLVNAASYRP
ncbi:polymorphic toxin-type HINT domain-containing protein, partial [Candidatus Omnitrophota bacterium]